MTAAACRWIPDTSQGGSWLATAIATGTFGVTHPDCLEGVGHVVVATDLDLGSPLRPLSEFLTGSVVVLHGTVVAAPYEGRAHLFRRRAGHDAVVDPFRVAVRWSGLGRLPAAALGESVAEGLRLSASRQRAAVVAEMATPPPLDGPVNRAQLDALGVARTLRSTRGSGRALPAAELESAGVCRAAEVLGGRATEGAAVAVGGQMLPVVVTAGAGRVGNLPVTVESDEVVVVWDFDGRADVGEVTVRRVTHSRAVVWQVECTAPDRGSQR